MAEALPQSDKLHVFVSYSRDDLGFADQLVEGLELTGFAPTIDRHGISGGEAWEKRLGTLIREADTVVFVLSPASAVSKICTWEVDEAARLNKRILPVLPCALGDVGAPQTLKDLNYIFFYDEPKLPGSGFGSGLRRLVNALNTDLDWLREHTRLLARAFEWEAAGRPGNRLLSGGDINDAKAWAALRPREAPPLTGLHLDFIRASEAAEEARASTERRQLEEMARAQAERANALKEAERALDLAAEAQARRIRLRNAALAAVTLVAVIAGWQAWRAEGQRKEVRDLLGRAIGLINTSELLRQTALDADTTETILGIAEKGSALGDAAAMAMLGNLYLYDLKGVAPDHSKGVLWLERAASEGDAGAMFSLGVTFYSGKGAPRNHEKSLSWFLKAAAAGNVGAMALLGETYAHGTGVPQDYQHARVWWSKVVNAYEGKALREERSETRHGGKPGKKTARTLITISWYALVATDFSRALTIGERAHALFPEDLPVESNRAHALMLLGRADEARAIYLAHKGKPASENANKLWERAIVDDFVKLRKAGITHDQMAEIEREFGVAATGR